MKWYEPQIEQIHEDLYRVPLPLPSEGLRAVNSYVLTCDGSVTLVDPGWDDAPSRAALETALRDLGHGFGDIERSLVTHLHRDHIGMAISLRDDFGIKIAVGERERVGLEWATANRWDTPAPQIRQMRAFGAWELADRMAEAGRDPDISDSSWQLADHWLQDGEPIKCGENSLEVVATPGHTRGHAVFKDSADRFIITGDHLLPHITPSIGFDAVPQSSPLTAFLASLDRIADLPSMQYLPAHGGVADSTHERVQELVVHHRRRLAEMTQCLVSGPKCAAEVAMVVPWTSRCRDFAELDWFNQMLAVIETDAHLMNSVERGTTVIGDVDGVRTYQLVRS